MAALKGRAGTDGTPAARPGQVAREVAFRRALSHSRKVQFLKLALPLAALLIAGSFGAYSYLSVPGAVSFDISESAFADGKLVMANPKLDGYTKSNRPYSMSATRALQHLDDSSIVDLEGIDAKMPVGGTNIATIGAARGIYNREQNTLDLPSPITVRTSDGMTVKLKSAHIDILKGRIKTKNPVSIDMNGMQLDADSMRVLENGQVMIFERRVKMFIQPGRFKEGALAKDETGEKNVQD